MSLSLPVSERVSVFAMAVLCSVATIGTAVSPAPVMANDGPYYTATLAQPATDDGAVAAGVAWACKGTTCVANKGTSRPTRICRGLAREMGEIAAFTAKGEELAADKLAKCNGN